MSNNKSRVALAALKRWVQSGKSRQQIAAALAISPSTLSRYLSDDPSQQRAQLQAETLARFETTIPRGFWPEPASAPRGAPRVFLSSTYLDNAERRQLVLDAIASAHCVPVMMEHWTGSELPVLEHCLEQLDSADVLIGIVAHRYGHLPAGQEHSITELEFRHATKRGLDRLMFLYQEKPKDLDVEFDSMPARWKLQDKLEAFRELVRSSGCTPVPFKDNTLSKLVFQALQSWKTRKGIDSARTAPNSDQKHEVEAAESQAAVSAYYDLVLRHLGRLQTGGFKTPFDLRIEFEDLYVPLALVVDREHHTNGKNAGYGERKRSATANSQAVSADELHPFYEPIHLRNETTLRQAIGDLWDSGSKHRSLVILGHPGSGKTTLAKGLVVLSARHRAEKVGLPKGAIPIFIDLRACPKTIAQLAKGRDEDAIPGLISARLQSEPYALDEERVQLLLGHPLLLILDGLDEVPSKDRAHFKRWVPAFTSANDDHRVLVTARFLGYSADSRLPREQTQVLEILTLDPVRREGIVRRWFKAAAEAESNRDQLEEESKNKVLLEAEEQASQLLASLDADLGSNLEALASNPLLLTVLCVVYRQRRGGLPTNRVELYEEYVDGLLALWRQNQQISLRLRFDWTRARRVLEPIALWLHQQEGRTQASIDDPEFLKVVGDALERAGSSEGFDPGEFLEAIRDESGLIVGHSDDHYGFLHLRFQEYLAACELRIQLLKTKRGDRAFRAAIRSQLVDRLGQGWWRELLHGLLGNPHSEPLFVPFVEEFLETKPTPAALSQFSELARIVPSFDPEPFIDFLQKAPDSTSGTLGDIVRRLLLTRSPRSLQALNEQFKTAERNAGTKAPGGSTIETINALGIRFSRIPAGRFMMGSPRIEPGRWAHEWEPHEVRLPEFSFAVTPITNAQYRTYLNSVAKAKRPTYWGDERFNQEDQPVVGIDWNEADAFCSWVTSKLGDGSLVRLPTEAEWEYACRAGSTTRFWSGSEERDLARVGWYDKNSGDALHAVAEKPANPWGLYDMHGNVWEWCSDLFTEPQIPSEGNSMELKPTAVERSFDLGATRVVRGGCFDSGSWRSRSAFRHGDPPSGRGPTLGFRPVRVMP